MFTYTVRDMGTGKQFSTRSKQRILDFFNEKTGANVQTAHELNEYADAHPECLPLVGLEPLPKVSAHPAAGNPGGLVNGGLSQRYWQPAQSDPWGTG